MRTGVRRMAWIETVDPDSAEGELKELYEEILRKRGAVANVYRVHSLNPGSLRDHLDLYLTLMFAPSPLSRKERESIAVAVSHANRCRYCVTHHSEPLVRLAKDEGFASEVMEGGGSLSGRERALIRFAEKLTHDPGGMEEADVASLRAEGLSDREILDATLVTSYFNFVNRVVLATGVELEG
jgi:uncharacterized peroxidase-related enzyme